MSAAEVAMLALFLVPLLTAGPARCVATWTGPGPACALRGEVKASAAGPSEKVAERAVLRQLADVAALSVDAQRARVPTHTATEFAGCADVVRDEAYVNCFSDDTLAAEALCFVELADPTCWNGQVLTVEGVGWQTLATGRKKLCDAVDARLVEQNYTDLASRRAICAASCASKTTVRCP